MGKTGLFLFDKAQGMGSHELSSRRLPKSIGNETTFHEDTVDGQVIQSILSYLTEKAATRLRRQGLRARCVTLKLRYSDFQTLTRNHTFHEPTDVDQEIVQAVFNLFRAAFTRRTRVRLVGVTLSKFVSGPWQMTLPLLVGQDNEKWRSLFRKVDEIRDRYGFTSLLNAHSSLYREPRPKTNNQQKLE
jgi:DNA polymerase-4